MQSIVNHVDKVITKLVKQIEEEEGQDFDFLNHGSENENHDEEDCRMLTDSSSISDIDDE